MDSLDDLKLIDGRLNLSEGNTRRLIYHYSIHGVCEYALCSKGIERTVIVYRPNTLPTRYMTSYYDLDEGRIFFNRLI